MDIFLIIGIVVGALAVVVGMIVKGANVAVLLNPAAAIIILIGTTAAVMNSFPRKEFLNIPKVLAALFREKQPYDAVSLIELITDMAMTARKDGLLSLEQTIMEIEDRYLQKGLSLVVDGLEHDYIQEIMEMEIDNMEDRHRANASIFSAAGSYAPTLGVLGAVVGLIGALGNLNDTEKLGHMIAAAFVATLFGIFLGYVVCHPIASRLKRKSAAETKNMRIIVEGVLALQAGENPSSIKVRLTGMLDPKERKILEEKEKNKQGSGE
ncbi:MULTISPECIES: flagellar motor stator protein MotA [unclassified Dehalobacter]|uniref:flagellar motor stator protein MotA n=1 Tax=unclassified Dehalobacter TaxID=2635733 RepID=UPI000E6BC968|nr:MULTISPECIES: flagellar motor stator protein MotA [unclassified Dehalobacter]RJE47994.1 flagellar motor protein MotA [Dehalobacter sp. MCB1]TCX50598.1 flagellar motor protein MotA [Dehalobacter sp. 14DCB1]TCX52158.1 flagellar motor protein MotA [Dehalobacter sp. 12DCB1]